MEFLKLLEKILYIINLLEDIYISNVLCDLSCKQHQDFVYGGKRINNDGYNQGGSNVYIVIEKWLKFVCNKNIPVFENGLF